MMIEAIEGTTATVSAGGSKLSANVMLIDDPKVGEYVLVHAGFAIQKVHEREAEETIRILNELTQ